MITNLILFPYFQKDHSNKEQFLSYLALILRSFDSHVEFQKVDMWDDQRRLALWDYETPNHNHHEILLL